MMKKSLFLFTALGIVLGGCYNYPAVPKTLESTDFFTRKVARDDDELRGITELTLEAAQHIALKNNPDYISAYHSVNAAKMAYYQSLGAYSPTLSAYFNLNYTHSRRYQDSDGLTRKTNVTATTVGLTASYLIFDGFARYLKVKIADAQFNYQKLMEEDACRLLIRSVAYAYNEIQLAREKRRIAEEDMDFQMKNLKDTELKHEHGAVPLSDVLNFKIYVNNAENSKIVADYQYQTAVFSLAQLMGYADGKLPPGITFPDRTLDMNEILPSVDTYLDTALSNRPDLAGYREQVKVARYNKYKSFSAYSPTVSGYGTVEYGTTNNTYGGYGTDYFGKGPNFAVGVEAEWLIFNGFIRYNQTRETEAVLAATEYSLVSQWLSVVNEVRVAHENYQQSIRQARLYEKTLELTSKQRDLVEEEFNAGSAEITRLNEAQRDLIDAQSTLATAVINVRNARAQLEAASASNVAGFYHGHDSLNESFGSEAYDRAKEAQKAREKAKAEQDSVALKRKNTANMNENAATLGTPASVQKK
ncbi:MAG: TolC family protein [Victivallaceae bacterium]|nr:TolC family protein [Victivallaceae bacterium]